MAICDLTNERIKELRDKCDYLSEDLNELLASRPADNDYESHFVSSHAYQKALDDYSVHPSVYHSLKLGKNLAEIRIDKKTHKFYVYIKGFINQITPSISEVVSPDVVIDIDCSTCKIGPYGDFNIVRFDFGNVLKWLFNAFEFKQTELF